MNSPQSQTVEHQPLPVRLRGDLIVAQTGTNQNPLWTVKDPISERFFQLRSADYFVFQHLDGETSLAEIQSLYHASHAPRHLSEEQVLNFVQRLASQGLVLVDKFGLSSTIANRSRRLKSSERKQKLSSVLAIRFRGIDPDRFLERLLPSVRWMFSPLAVLLSILLLCGAVMIACAESETISREMPRFSTFLQSGKLFWFLAIIAGIKVLHELGHAFACKRFGGECHELGVLLLAFTPCLYCNVSDAWLLKNRWHRIAISGAGMYVEVVIASICTYFWFWSVPGTLHTVCLYVMVISSFSTILLNGNPLLRYDGYYILSDWVGVVNLRSRSQGLVGSWLTRLFFGIRTADPLRGERCSKLFLGVYGLLSGLYMWVVVFAILWMLYQFAKPYGLEVVVVALGVVILSQRIVGLLTRLLTSVKVLHKQGRLRMLRVGITMGIAVACLYGIAMFEFPRRLRAPCIITASQSRPVFVSAAGSVEFVNLAPGTSVKEGDVLARLNNPELQFELLKLQGKVEQQKKRIDLLTQRQVTDLAAAAELPSALASLLDFQAQQRNKQTELERLTLKAPQSGLLIPPEIVPSPQSKEPEFQRVGQPFEASNEGAWLEPGTMLCRVAETVEEDATALKYDALVYFEQSEAVLLAPGMSVCFTTSQTAGQMIVGEVVKIAAQPIETVPPILLRLNLIPFEANQNGKLRPASPIHEVRVRINGNTRFALGQTGQAVVHLESETILASTLRLLRQTFTFDL